MNIIYIDPHSEYEEIDVPWGPYIVPADEADNPWIWELHECSSEEELFQVAFEREIEIYHLAQTSLFPVGGENNAP